LLLLAAFERSDTPGRRLTIPPCRA
jgi:hypothetical protein